MTLQHKRDKREWRLVCGACSRENELRVIVGAQPPPSTIRCCIGCGAQRLWWEYVGIVAISEDERVYCDQQFSNDADGGAPSYCARTDGHKGLHSTSVGTS